MGSRDDIALNSKSESGVDEARSTLSFPELQACHSGPPEAGKNLFLIRLHLSLAVVSL